MTAPLFDPQAYIPAREEQGCERCLTKVWASDDQLRILGWLCFDGLSTSGEPLHVRICPACQRHGQK